MVMMTMTVIMVMHVNCSIVDGKWRWKTRRERKNTHNKKYVVSHTVSTHHISRQTPHTLTRIDRQLLVVAMPLWSGVVVLTVK